ncbi:MAG: hypothetical protein WCJ13_03470 [Coriobacteriia bacterium]
MLRKKTDIKTPSDPVPAPVDGVEPLPSSAPTEPAVLVPPAQPPGSTSPGLYWPKAWRPEATAQPTEAPAQDLPPAQPPQPAPPLQPGQVAPPLQPQLKKKRKKKRGAKGSWGIGGMLVMAFVIFAVAIALALWIQGLFSGLDQRLTQTQKEVTTIGAIGTGGSSAAGSASATATGRSSSATTATQGAAAEAAPTLDTVIGRLVKAEKKANFWDVTIDPAQLLTGKAASSIAAHRGKVPVNGQFLDDSTNATRMIPCSEGAPVTSAGAQGGASAPTTAKALFAALEGPDSTYWREQYFRMTIDSDYIVRYEQFTVGK